MSKTLTAGALGLLALLAGSATSSDAACGTDCVTSSGSAACNNRGQTCWIGTGRDPSVGIYVTGPGCDKICEVSKNCYGRVVATAKHKRERTSTETPADAVKAMCMRA